jgi:hypothetical protein
MEAKSDSQKLIEAIPHLDHEQVAALWSLVQVMSPALKEHPSYDPSKDTLPGMFSGPTDASSRVKETVYGALEKDTDKS